MLVFFPGKDVGGCWVGVAEGKVVAIRIELKAVGDSDCDSSSSSAESGIFYACSDF